MFRSSLIVATSFAIIESAYRYPDGVTTIEQFVLNLLYTPILIHGYERVVLNNYLRILLFPFNVWLAEMVMGTFMLNVLGYRIWLYDDALALCDNHITLSFFHWWILLGMLVSCCFWIDIYTPIIYAVQEIRRTSDTLFRSIVYSRHLLPS